MYRDPLAGPIAVMPPNNRHNHEGIHECRKFIVIYVRRTMTFMVAENDALETSDLFSALTLQLGARFTCLVVPILHCH